MGARPTKSKANIFTQARLNAARYNERLSSRDGAAEELGYASGSTIADWELGIKKPSPEAVLKMSDTYHAPELVNHYCVHMCPLGCGVQEASVEGIDRITIKAMSVLSKASEIQDELLEIVGDGQISGEERKEMMSIVDTLNEMEQVTESLKIWIKKNL